MKTIKKQSNENKKMLRRVEKLEKDMRQIIAAIRARVNKKSKH
jgi:hypothetical protein